ncbi:MAG TPA: homoserine kinase [Geminicoccus sp.]|jgi:homoserine kinase type II|uniref:homoserine kinase n=1 Tax=Geminicoccus sp. TaxID=2024832 RepID=UPI002E2FD876|nr:homoserine kinase [Geminicoccus sp.]HEX2527192.1 homoserine kinase [Geminicoccus sp.]
MAVYTPVDRADLEPFLADYPLGRLIEHRGIQAGVENSNFFVDTERGRYVLTIYERRVNPADLPFYLGLMEHLAERGIHCPLPIHGTDGKVRRELMGKPAAIVTFLEGHCVEQITPAHCRALGAALAQLHREGRDFPIRRANDLSVKGWRRLLDLCEPDADRVLSGLAQELERDFQDILSAWPAALPAGVIHGDLFPDNIFFRDTEVTGIIDFYFACNDLLAYDLAVCLVAWCFDGQHLFLPERAEALVEGYRSERPLEPAEKAALPRLCRGASLRFLLTRLYDWLNQVDGALVQPKDPLEYLAKLRFFRTMTDPAACGVR